MKINIKSKNIIAKRIKIHIALNLYKLKPKINCLFKFMKINKCQNIILLVRCMKVKLTAYYINCSYLHIIMVIMTTMVY